MSSDPGDLLKIVYHHHQITTMFFSIPIYVYRYTKYTYINYSTSFKTLKENYPEHKQRHWINQSHHQTQPNELKMNFYNGINKPFQFLYLKHKFSKENA